MPPSSGTSQAEDLVLRRAKRLRQNLTGPEAKLWTHLKRINTVDTHFRKQVPIGPYVVDFACIRGRVVVEVDGDQHGWHAGRQRDRRRDRFLGDQGFSVLRFWNHEVLQEMESVLDTIHASLHGRMDAPARSMSKRAEAGGLAPTSPSMGEVVRLAGPEGVTTRTRPSRGT
jgi:very-short-patch-repair endonuclease